VGATWNQHFARLAKCKPSKHTMASK